MKNQAYFIKHYLKITQNFLQHPGNLQQADKAQQPQQQRQQIAPIISASINRTMINGNHHFTAHFPSALHLKIDGQSSSVVHPFSFTWTALHVILSLTSSTNETLFLVWSCILHITRLFIFRYQNLLDLIEIDPTSIFGIGKRYECDNNPNDNWN